MFRGAFRLECPATGSLITMARLRLATSYQIVSTVLEMLVFLAPFLGSRHTWSGEDKSSAIIVCLFERTALRLWPQQPAHLQLRLDPRTQLTDVKSRRARAKWRLFIIFTISKASQKLNSDVGASAGEIGCLEFVGR